MRHSRFIESSGRTNWSPISYMTVTSCLISISVVTGRTDRHHSLDNESPILLIGYGMFLSLSFMLEEIVLVIFSLVFCLHHVLSVWAGRVCESRWRARAGRCPAPSWSWRCWRCTQGPAWPRAARSAPCVPVSIHTHTHYTCIQGARWRARVGRCSHYTTRTYTQTQITYTHTHQS